MDRQHYDRIQCAFGRGHRVPTHEFIDVPAALYPTVKGLFMKIAKLDPAGEKLRIARIWTENGKLRVTVIGGAVGLGDIIADAQEEAATLLGGDIR